MNNRSFLLSVENRTRTAPRYRASSGPVLFFILLLMVISFSSSAIGQAPPPKWKQGDVFLGVGGGQWKVFRPSSGAFVDTVSDGIASPGATNGSALDNTWHLIGTDSGSSANVSKIVRFRISPHDPNNPTPLADVLSVKDGSAGTGI